MTELGVAAKAEAKARELRIQKRQRQTAKRQKAVAIAERRELERIRLVQGELRAGFYERNPHLKAAA